MGANNGGNDWTLLAGPGGLNGTTLSFAAAALPISLVAGQRYVFALYTLSSVVRFDTAEGSMFVQLRPDAAPKTVANFLNYVRRGAYDNSFIHRSVPGFVIQGGGYKYVQPDTYSIPADPPVQNEYALSNVRGTLAMAKLSGDPNSATSQWFFNLSDSNAANLNAQNGGFTVFGKVLDAGSLTVMDRIAALPTINSGSPFDQLPVRNYQSGAVQGSNLVTVITVVPLT